MITEVREINHQQNRAISLNEKNSKEAIDFVKSSTSNLSNEFYRLTERYNKQEDHLKKESINFERRHKYTDKRINEMEILIRMLRIHETSKAEQTDFE